MDWMVGLALLVFIYAVFLLIRRKQPPAAPAETPEPRILRSLRQFEGRECIFTDGRVALKTQIQQMDVVDDHIRISLQPLRTEGLSESPEPSLLLSEAAGSIEYAEDVVLARYANWRLYFSRELIHHITVIARKGADMKIMQRTILDFKSDSEDRPDV